MKEKIKKILRWIHWHAPIITTRWRMRSYADDMISEVMEIEKRADRIAVNPAIHSLQELRKNTWDVERVDRTINWLKNKFWREEK